jgi:homoserine dehydrogenase
LELPVLELNIILVGFGNVGRAFARIISERQSFLRDRHRLSLRLKAIADSSGTVLLPTGTAGLETAQDKIGEILAWKNSGRSLGEFPVNGNPGESWRQTLGAGDVLVELSPTNLVDGQPGLSYIREALDRGLHAVTGNKGPIVHAYRELAKRAADKGVGLKFGGATAGALPTTNVGYYDLAGAEITGITGILNGTTNFILTQMSQNRQPFGEALAEAQNRGIAERDPSLDVDGWDTAAKALILANVLMSADISLGEVHRQGIGEVTLNDIEGAHSRGAVIKLIGRASRNGQSVKVQVATEEVPLAQPLARVDGTNKGVTFETDLMGPLTVSGGNSGPAPAAAAVLRDIINLARELHPALGGKSHQ